MSLMTSCQDPCNDVECLNGGTCIEGDCECAEGFTGPNCGTLIDPCADVECFNGGTCMDGNCECAEGYTGTNCENVDLAKVQFLLDAGKSPKTLFDAGVPLDSLYGKTYAGGLIFFVNTEPANYPDFEGEGLVCTDRDYGNFDEWGCFVETGARGRTVGTGKENTRIMIDRMCARAPKSAIICDDLVLNGFDDWWLPSIDEVDLIYRNLHLKGHNDFLGNIQRYQSSTEHDATNFVLRLFWRDTIVNINKISGDDIRPTRAF